jgi:DNA excision repair protein ERCC-4
VKKCKIIEESRFPSIAIDTREQNPFWFPSDIPTQIRSLKTGDYSLVGYEDQVAIERKSKSDCYGSLSSGRNRFERELERLKELDFAAIVIESSISEFLLAPGYSQMNPKSALRSLIAWSVKYRVPVCWGDDRPHAAALTLSLLQFWWKYSQIRRISSEQHIAAASN